MGGGGKGGSNSTTQSAIQTYQPDPKVAEAGHQAINMAESAVQAPFQQPVAPVAGFTPQQQQGFQATSQMQGMAQPYLQQASQLATKSAQPVSAAQVQNYYNPFSQNVMANLQETFGQQQRDTTGQLTQAAGGVGADRIAVGQSELARQQGLAAGQTAANIYQPALYAALTDPQRQAQAAFALGSIGPAAQTAQLQGIGAELGTGGQQQNLAQAQQTAQYQQTLAGLGYPFQTAQYLAGIAGGLGPALGGTTIMNGSAQGPTPSFGQQAAGAGLGLAGVGGSLFGGNLGVTSASPFSGFSGGFARGGNVPLRQLGGVIPTGAVPGMSGAAGGTPGGSLFGGTLGVNAATPMSGAGGMDTAMPLMGGAMLGQNRQRRDEGGAVEDTGAPPQPHATSVVPGAPGAKSSVVPGGAVKGGSGERPMMPLIGPMPSNNTNMQLAQGFGALGGQALKNFSSDEGSHEQQGGAVGTGIGDDPFKAMGDSPVVPDEPMRPGSGERPMLHPPQPQQQGGGGGGKGAMGQVAGMLPMMMMKGSGGRIPEFAYGGAAPEHFQEGGDIGGGMKGGGGGGGKGSMDSGGGGGGGDWSGGGGGDMGGMGGMGDMMPSSGWGITEGPNAMGDMGGMGGGPQTPNQTDVNTQQPTGTDQPVDTSLEKAQKPFAGGSQKITQALQKGMQGMQQPQGGGGARGITPQPSESLGSSAQTPDTQSLGPQSILQGLGANNVANAQGMQGGQGMGALGGTSPQNLAMSMMNPAFAAGSPIAAASPNIAGQQQGLLGQGGMGGLGGLGGQGGSPLGGGAGLNDVTKTPPAINPVQQEAQGVAAQAQNPFQKIQQSEVLSDANQVGKPGDQLAMADISKMQSARPQPVPQQPPAPAQPPTQGQSPFGGPPQPGGSQGPSAGQGLGHLPPPPPTQTPNAAGVPGLQGGPSGTSPFRPPPPPPPQPAPGAGAVPAPSPTATQPPAPPPQPPVQPAQQNAAMPGYRDPMMDQGAMNRALNATARNETGHGWSAQSAANVSADAALGTGHPSQSYGSLGLNSASGSVPRDWGNMSSGQKMAYEQQAYGKIYNNVPEALTSHGISPEIANNPGVKAYMADRGIQMGDSEHGVGRNDAIQAASGAKTPQDFIRQVSDFDRAHVTQHFNSALNTGTASVRGLQNRIASREQFAMNEAGGGQGLGRGIGSPQAAQPQQINSQAITKTLGDAGIKHPITGEPISQAQIDQAVAKYGTNGTVNPQQARQMLDDMKKMGVTVTPEQQAKLDEALKPYETPAPAAGSQPNVKPWGQPGDVRPPRDRAYPEGTRMAGQPGGPGNRDPNTGAPYGRRYQPAMRNPDGSINWNVLGPAMIRAGAGLAGTRPAEAVSGALSGFGTGMQQGIASGQGEQSIASRGEALHAQALHAAAQTGLVNTQAESASRELQRGKSADEAVAGLAAGQPPGLGAQGLTQAKIATGQMGNPMAGILGMPSQAAGEAAGQTGAPGQTGTAAGQPQEQPGKVQAVGHQAQQPQMAEGQPTIGGAMQQRQQQEQEQQIQKAKAGWEESLQRAHQLEATADIYRNKGNAEQRREAAQLQSEANTLRGQVRAEQQFYATPRAYQKDPLLGGTTYGTPVPGDQEHFQIPTPLGQPAGGAGAAPGHSNAAMYFGVDPQQIRSAIESGAHGDDLLKQLPPNYAQGIKRMVEGSEQPPSAGLGGQAMRMMNNLNQQVARQYDPNWNQDVFKQKSKLWDEYTNPRGQGPGRSRQAFFTLMGEQGHVKELSNSIDELHNARVRLGNQFTNWLSTEAGKSAVTNFNTNRDAVSTEISYLLKGGVPGVEDTKREVEHFDAKNSPEQLYGSLDKMARLFNGRARGIGDNYEADMQATAPGAHRQLTTLTPEMKRTEEYVHQKYIAAGGKEAGGAQRPQGAPTSGASNDPMEGRTATNPQTGAKMIRRNGQWVAQ